MMTKVPAVNISETADHFHVELAAALAPGDGPERVYIVEPTGSFEDDPNVTNMKFPGNPTRSYRSREPLKIVGELAEWQRSLPEQIQRIRDRFAGKKDEIINCHKS